MIKWDKFGRDVLRQRDVANLSVRNMAKKCQVTHATLSRAERGLPISADSLLKISSYVLDKDPRLYLL
jgi:transcriptional regulator with XRE-family HTH domain